MIRIRARRDGFRRCGVAHPAIPIEYPDDRWTAEELEMLQADPMLMVEVIAGGAEAEPPSDEAIGEAPAPAPRKGRKE